MAPTRVPAHKAAADATAGTHGAEAAAVAERRRRTSTDAAATDAAAADPMADRAPSDDCMAAAATQMMAAAELQHMRGVATAAELSQLQAGGGCWGYGVGVGWG